MALPFVKKKKKKCSKIDIFQNFVEFHRIHSMKISPSPDKYLLKIFFKSNYTRHEREYTRIEIRTCERTYFAQRKLCQRMNNNRSPVYSKLANILINITPISPFLPSLVRDNFNCALDTDSRKQNFHLP